MYDLKIFKEERSHHIRCAVYGVCYVDGRIRSTIVRLSSSIEKNIFGCLPYSVRKYIDVLANSFLRLCLHWMR